MTKIIDRTGKGSALTAAENDANLSSLSGINESQTGTTYTVTIDDQNRTIELSNASAVTVTLTAIATIAAALHTDDFKVTLINIGAGTVTVNRSSTDTFNGGGTSVTLATDEWITIQTDSTGAIWNIVNGNYTSIALTTPVINGKPGYGMVILDTPELLFDHTAGYYVDATWISTSNSSSTTLPDASAVSAIVKLITISDFAGTTNVARNYIRKGGTALAANFATLNAGDGSGLTSGTATSNAVGVSVVNLDSNSDFEVYFSVSGGGTVDGAYVYLLGYYT